jgi:glycosyltransferase involved in cell wall biosynthesis
MPAFIDSTLGAQIARVPILINTDHCKQYPIERHWQVLENGASRLADTVVAVSHHTRNELIQYQRMAPEKVQVIYNGIDVKLRRADTPADIRRELGLQPDDVVFGTAARLEVQKGLELLIDAAPFVLRRMPKARFLIVGGGSLEHDLRQRAAALGLERQVIVTGYRTDAVDLMQTFDCFVQTSLFEGMPMALLEAMALNKPIVATAVGGVPEVVEDGVCARLIASRDPQDLTDALVSVTADPVVRKRIGDAGRERYERNFTAAAMVSQYERLYNHFLARKRARVH